MLDKKELTQEEHTAKRRAVEEYYKRRPRAVTGVARNVVGVGIGPKGTGNSDKPGVHVYVDRLMDHKGPVEIPGDIKTHAIESGRFFSFQAKASPGSTIGLGFKDPDKRPNVNAAAEGTLGAIVKIGDKHYALGSNHVMAVNGRVPTGTRLVFRPPDEFIDEDPTKFIFAKTTVHVPLHLNLDPDEPNHVDCALAEIEEEYMDRVHAEFPDRLVDYSELLDPALDMEVVRVDDGGPGIAGKIVDVAARVRLDFSFGTFDFDHQVIIEPNDGGKSFAFARPGDSGALIVSQGKAVALVVGGSENFTIACPLKRVFAELTEALGKLHEDRAMRSDAPAEPHKIELIVDPVRQQPTRAAGR